MTTAYWTILIPTIGRRQRKFLELWGSLRAQIEPYPTISVLAYYNNGERTLGAIRQALVEAALSDYISFVDDDDQVPDYYVEKVVDAINAYAIAAGREWGSTGHWPKGGGLLPDQIGWRMQHYADRVPSKPTYHSIDYDHWWDDEKGYYRDHSHLNPIRRKIAIEHGDFRRGDPPEDVGWADQIRGNVKTEARIPDEFVMYHYFSSGDSTWRPGSVSADPAYSRPVIEHEQFRWHPDSSE